VLYCVTKCLLTVAHSTQAQASVLYDYMIICALARKTWCSNGGGFDDNRSHAIQARANDSFSVPQFLTCCLKRAVLLCRDLVRSRKISYALPQTCTKDDILCKHPTPPALSILPSTNAKLRSPVPRPFLARITGRYAPA
jgi:hypothetical protein